MTPVTVLVLVCSCGNQSINQSIEVFYSGLSNLNHYEVHYSARRKDCCIGNVFKWRLNDCNIEAETMCSGREFQVWAAATGKARLPTVASLTGGTTRQFHSKLLYLYTSKYLLTCWSHFYKKNNGQLQQTTWALSSSEYKVLAITHKSPAMSVSTANDVWVFQGIMNVLQMSSVSNTMGDSSRYFPNSQSSALPYKYKNKLMFSKNLSTGV